MEDWMNRIETKIDLLTVDVQNLKTKNGVIAGISASISTVCSTVITCIGMYIGLKSSP